MSELMTMDDAIDYVLKQATGLDLEVLAHEKKSTGVGYQNRKVDQFTFSETHQLGVRILDGKNEGVAFTESLDRESLDEVVAQARDNARMIQKEWTAELRPKSDLPKMDALFNPKLEDVPVDKKLEAAGILEAAALDFDPAIKAVAYTRYSDVSARTWIANTRGLRGDYRQNFCMAYTYCVAQDGENSVVAGETRADRDFAKLDPRAIALEAAQKALARRGAVRPDTGVYTVVFENRAAENLIGLVSGYFSGKSIDEGTSPLKGKLGTQVFSPKLSLSDDPFHPRAGGSRPFDEEGFASKKTPLIENGVVKNFLTNSVLARKLSLPHTASASRSPSSDLDVGSTNLVVANGASTFADLVSSDNKVIVVTNIQGSAGFRATSGDFSLPVEGELYENGRKVSPLKDFLLSGNILKILGDVEAVGDDAKDPVGSVISPSLLVRGVNVVGKS